jgi:hypothetical protein
MRITFVTCDNWVGVYFGNQLHCEDSRLDLIDIMEGVVGKTVLGVEHISLKDCLLYDGLPTTLTEFYQKQKEGEL